MIDMESYNIESSARWLRKHFPELESFKLNTKLRIRNGYLKALKILTQREFGRSIILNNKCDVDTFLDLDVDYNGEVRDNKIYILQGLLLNAGYSCDFTGMYERNTRLALRKYLKDNNISTDRECPYKVTSFIWCSFFAETNENSKEEK